MVMLTKNKYGGWNSAAAQEKGQAMINDYKTRMAAPFGGDYAAYMKSITPPQSPLDFDLNAIYSNSQGDKDYQVDQLNQYYQSPAGKKVMSDFYAANPEWYTPEGLRSNYTDDQKSALISMGMGNKIPGYQTPAQAVPAPQQQPAAPVQQAPQAFQSPFSWGSMNNAPLEGRKTMGMFGNAARANARQMRNRG